ncbi:MAG: beta-ketoacyl synthase N-terminal-like domain-containing protein, partial [Kangiellaceae bacterium]|nr:beta-ketoacyl synthase N-terminal-like domain-containing protein [Kangiellaceae bacterium]
NMFSEAFVDGMNEVFQHIADAAGYKAVVLIGYDNYFASGGTKETLLAIQEGKTKFTDRKVFQLAQDCPLPVIAAMQGHGIGGGWVLGAFADYWLFSEESRYVSPYMDYGFTPGAGSTFILPKRLGHDLARETLLTAQGRSGKALKDRGLAYPVVQRQSVEREAMALAKQLACHSRGRLMAFKQQWTQPLLAQLADCYQSELVMHEQTFVGQAKTLTQIKESFNQTDLGQTDLDQVDLDQADSDQTDLGETKTRETNLTDIQNTPQQTVATKADSALQSNNQPSVKENLKKLLASELHMDTDEVDEDAEFIELGLDSITGVTWIRNINEKYNISVEATKVYSHPTLSQFSGYIYDKYLKQLDHVKESEAEINVVKEAEAQESNSSQSPASVESDKQLVIESQLRISETLKSLLAEELHMEPAEIDEQAQFIDLGLDSITGVTWIRKINDRYGISMEATKVYSYPTIETLGQYLKGITNHSPSDEQTSTSSLSNNSANGENEAVSKSAEIKIEQVSWGKQLTSKRNQNRSKTISDSSTQTRPEPIAIIGMSGQFPSAKNLDEYWDNISQSRNCIKLIPTERWNKDNYYQSSDELQAGKTNSQWMGALDNYDRFDPLFFNISPLEAESMDPQQRLFLQTSWNAIENAGYNAASLSGSNCGVFVGVGTGDYQQFSREQQLSAQGFTGSASSILAARISYFLNLQGPCLSIDTACSSSLVALANACDSLVSSNCEIALAGGVFVMASPAMHIKAGQAGMLSRDGQCFTFDERANGFVPGEGVGVVMLKRLTDAEADGDLVHGVIQGWGVNQDGKSNGITAPNAESQSKLIVDVYKKFNIDPTQLQLIEAHGTGTKLGDPIEVEGLKSAFSEYTERTDYCALGSVKSNIGHCIAAAGISGILKVALALKHKQLPPTINFDRLNEHIRLNESPFFINTKLKDWEADEVRQGAVSSFGFSGTNAHVVLSEYRTLTTQRSFVDKSRKENAAIIILSAKTEKQLRERAKDLLKFLESLPGKENDPMVLENISYTLQVGREPMDERLGILIKSLSELSEKLVCFIDEQESIEGVFKGQVHTDKRDIKLISQDQEMKETILDKWIGDKNLSKIVGLWVKGLDFDWNRLYPQDKPSRIELPAYPFAQERLWLDSVEKTSLPVASVEKQYIHPLLHINSSTLSQQSYHSVFSGEEFFFKDHKVRIASSSCEKVLPGVAYLEMVKAAITNSLPQLASDSFVELKNIFWSTPFICDSQARLITNVSINEEQTLSFSIFSEPKNTMREVELECKENTLHCSGQA